MIVLVNGPPRSGKDTVGRILEGRGFLVEKFAAPIRDYMHLMHQLTETSIETCKQDLLDPDWSESVTVRDTMIAYSEAFMKPLFGADIFTRILAREIEGNRAGLDYVITDCGFQVEVDSLYHALKGSHDFLLLRLRRDGCTFEGDSRSYVEPTDSGMTLCHHGYISNDGTIEELSSVIEAEVDWVRNG